MPIETPTKIGIISNALVLLGEKPLTSLTEDRYGATVGNALFELLYETELQSNSWRFNTKKAALSRLVSVPVNQFTYAYQIPADCLLPRHVYPATRYEIFGDHLYTDDTSVDLDYQFKPDVSDLPAYFALLLTYALARDMAGPVTESEAKVKEYMSKYNIQRDRAMYADAQARPATSVQSSPFTDVRGA